jgi:predicted DsbA family dithiol-disulfide isomerase
MARDGRVPAGRMSDRHRVAEVEVQVWSDFACPWCALGLARFDAARREFEHGDEVRIVHRSYELHPRARESSEQTMVEATAAKYGTTPERVRSRYEHLAALGREVGLVFDFDRVKLGSTFDAHRLAQAARGTAGEDALLRGLFRAYFTDGLSLSDHDVLRKVAAAAGLDEGVTEKVLSGDLYAREVRLDEADALELDVTGVPFFLINGAWPIPGAQDVDTLLTVLRRAWSRSAH